MVSRRLLIDKQTDGQCLRICNTYRSCGLTCHAVSQCRTTRSIILAHGGRGPHTFGRGIFCSLSDGPDAAPPSLGCLLFTRRGLRLRDSQNTHHWSPRVNSGQRGWALTRLVLCLLRAQSRGYDRYPNTHFVLAAVYTEDNVGRLRDSVIGSAIVFVSWIRYLRAHGRPVRGPCTPFFHPLPPGTCLYQLQKMVQLCTALYSRHYIHFTVCTDISLEKPVV